MGNIARILLTGAIVLGLAGCSSYNKLIKSNDKEKMYNAALEYYEVKKNDRALFLFDAVAPYFSGTAREDSILFFSAVSSFRMGDFLTSGEKLNDFRRKFNRSVFIQEAEYLIAMGYYHQSPPPARDQTTSIMAINSFNEYISRYPGSERNEDCYARIVELTQKLYDKALLNANVYYNVEYFKSAIHAYKVSLMDYPETTHREETLYLITVSSYLLAYHSIEELQRGRYLDMLDAYYNLISEFPETKHLKEVTRMYDQVQLLLKRTEKQENS